ncbi:MAG: alpha/beta hydrolase [Eubacterium sp.]|nr:alpha/beta hydrolase [Eubacterium sp.]
MPYIKHSGSFNSSNGTDRCAYYVFLPHTEPYKCIIQISHGMREHIGRYEDFARFLTDRGYIVCGNDHLGHGNTAKSPDDLGYFAPKDGWSYLINDLHRLTVIMKNKYPSLPYVMIGHSMGSFIARLYAVRFSDELDAAIFMGTGDDKALSELGVRAARSASAINGERHRSDRLNTLIFGAYNERIKDRRTDYDWLSRDSAAVDGFMSDEKCDFIFTCSAFVDLTVLLSRVSSKKWAEQFPKELPVLLAAGTDDPVGGYGKGVLKVYEKLLAQGCHADIKLYPGARHELLNETIKNDVYNDLLWWTERAISR